MERPKLFKCPSNGLYTIWFHCDAPNFSLRSVGVATSKNIDGPYKFASHCFKPDGLDSYDMGVYQDGSGTYLVRSVANQYAGISKMNDMCQNVTGITSRTDYSTEGQAIMFVENKANPSLSRYYLWGSHLTGWSPNPAIFAESSGNTLEGAKWKVLGNPSNDGTTFNSQSTFILPFKHDDGHITYVYMGDKWNSGGPGGLDNMTLVWLPISPPKSGSGDWSMPWRSVWELENF